MKRGQISVFIIFAVILIATGGITFFLVKSGGFTKLDDEYFMQPSIKTQVDSITGEAKSCIEETSNDGLELIGLQGGYYKKPVHFFEVKDIFVPYYFYEGSITSPMKTDIEKELSMYVDDNLLDCFDKINFANFDIEYKNPRTNALIGSNDVRFEVDMTLTIKSNGKRTLINLKDLPIKKTSALKDIIEVAKYITDSHRADEEFLCVTCIANMAEEKNLYVDSLDFKENSALFIISENYTSSETYYFEFLNKYKE